MPIYDNSLSVDQMNKLANDGHTCGQCGGRLTVAWGGSINYEGFILRCANDIGHNTTTRHDKKHEDKLLKYREVNKLDTVGDSSSVVY